MSAIEKARSLRKAMTEAERALWYLLRARRFSSFKFRRQVPVGPYIADFLCYEARLVIEADGSQHVESSHDAKRDVWLRKQGLRVSRFWNHEIFTARREVEDTIFAALCTPHPTASPPPSPARGEGQVPIASASSPIASASAPARGEGKEHCP